MKKTWYIWLYLLFALAGCAKEEPQPPSLIMEGWIDADGHPMVMIHKSYVLSFGNDSSRTMEETVRDLLIPFGKVTVSDGEQEVVLTGKIDTAYMPPYSYSSTYIRGEVGKTYTFTAKYYDWYATATTTIPPKAQLDSLVVRSGQSQTVDIRAFLRVPEESQPSYYAIFVHRANEKQYLLCPFSVCESTAAVNGQIEIKLYNPDSQVENPELGIDFQFRRDTTAAGNTQVYRLKVARLDEPSYRFWKAYNELAVTKGILFVPVYKNIPSNVEGGYGNVSGMGASFYTLRISRDTVYRF